MKYLPKGLEFRTYHLNRKSVSDIFRNEEKKICVVGNLYTKHTLKQTKTGSIMS